ncbi:interferon gamma receptor 1-like isoform X2 [Narcine bancroftii]|uniref:interferon gamma receptor 1-like isoform X2 n=1 Tax=Narcine bancroftii TaxID=1343680 RepID=UPI00383140CD
MLMATMTFSPDEGDHELLPPMNLSVTSYNFKTILTWSYVDKTTDTTFFTVETRNYQSAQWQLFSPCSNISSHSCDVTKAFSVNLSPLSSYYAKVKATTYFQESLYAITDRFSFKENATLGPPTVDVMVHGQQVTLKCIFPRVEKLNTETGLNVNNDFKCKICVGQKGHNKLANCSIKRSRWKFNVTRSNVTLCVSAQVNSEQWKMKAEWSKQKCFKIHFLNLQDILIILFAVITIILGFSTINLLWKLFQKELVLPKSLIFIVKAINPHVEKIEEDAVSVVIKYEKMISSDHDLTFEEVAKPSTCPENTESHTSDLKYAGKAHEYDRPQNLENLH